MSDVHTDHEDGDTPVSMATFIQRVAIGVAAAATVGAGSVLISTSNVQHVHEVRITALETQIEKVKDIDRNVVILNGKVDVLNQKLDDAKDALRGGK